MNTLYYGDNLKVLREYIKDESVDLIYLDPPFNSNRSYNVLFKDESGMSDAQITAFDDAWHWGETAERTYQDLIQNAPMNVAQMIGALREFIGANQMLAYLVMMAARLVELQRVLKPTGSLYLHCDPTASHYLKILLDMIFGVMNFGNEIIWKRADTVKGNFGQGKNSFDPNTDTILFYRKTSKNIFNTQFKSYRGEYINQFYKFVEPETGRRYQLISMTGPGGAAKGNPEYEVMGVTRFWRYSKDKMNELIDKGLVVQTNRGAVPRKKQYLDEGKGVSIQSLWDDIPALHSQAAERLGYPTQKPLALLERIIEASSNPGDVVLDPFSGCGTCISAAQKLGRQWIGIDITHLAIAMHKSRLKDMFGLEPKKDYAVVGEPEDLAGAHQLAHDDRYQFQWWALSLIKARPLGGDGGRTGKKGADRGIDGAINFLEERGAVRRALVQVKSGHVKAGDIRDLAGTLDAEGAQIGVFLTLEEPSRDMVSAAASAGFYHSDLWQKDYPRIQILSVEQLLNGEEVRIPPTPVGSEAFKKAGKSEKSGAKQAELGI